MRLIRVAGAALNQVPLDWDGNLSRIRASISEAKAQSASLLCLPELCISGYGCEDAFFAPHVHDEAWEGLLALLPETEGMVVTVGLPLSYRGTIFNTTAVAADGKLVALLPKKALAGDGVYYEPRWFKPWHTGVVEVYSNDGLSVPIGDLFLECGDIKIGFELCEEAWVANRPGATLAGKGVDLILNPSASHFSFGKLEIRKRFVLEGSRAFGAAYVYSNLVGNESGRIIFDGGVLIADQGRMVAQGPRFTYRDALVTTAVVDVALNRMNRGRTASYQPLLEREHEGSVRVEFEWPEVSSAEKASHSSLHPMGEMSQMSPMSKEEEFLRAVALGLFDYMRKSRSRGFVVSLSGGVDSSAVCSLVAASIVLAEKELGIEGVRRKLPYLPELAHARAARECMEHFLLTLYQATRNSSEATRTAAQEVSKALGAKYWEWDVDDFVESYVGRASKALGRALDWKHDDIALQNIQARVRAPGAWMLANVRGALLLSTSNRSEAAVGYATMDGDTSGGLCPIAGIDEAYLKRWLSWLETTGIPEFGPIPELSYVTRMPPTAELRPQEQAQTDEKDLMPYEVLDRVERLFILERRSPLEAYRILASENPAVPKSEVKAWVKRFFELWCRNQWKRERYAPSFHLDDESLDPKTWCRFPILSGGYARELAEMEGAE